LDAPLIDFFRAARGAGVRLSPAEAIDAARAVAAIGWENRASVRDALSLTLAKTADEHAALADVFDRFFARTPVAAPSEELAALLDAGDAASVDAALEAAAEAVGLGDIVVFTQVNMFARRMLDAIGETALPEGVAEDARAGLRAQARAMAERALDLYAREGTERWREQALRRARLATIDRRDIPRMAALVRALARRLAARFGRTRRVARRGALDVRRTIRRSAAHGGVPMVPTWRTRKIEKPKLVVLCDVSGSVAGVSGFLLLFLWCLRDALTGLRAFAFTSDAIEVTDLLDRFDAGDVAEAVFARVGGGSSAYGAALASLDRGAIDRRTTLLVLGDGRGNRTDPRVAVLAELARRAKQVIWLNPEPRTLWGTGDSDMSRYATHCRVAAVCATLDQLERIVERLLRDG